jgi:hypothetical protein
MGVDGQVWRLHDGDDVLAELTVIEADWPWLRARVVATEAFERVRPLFDDELRLLELDESVDDWEAAYARISSTLDLARPDGVRVAEFLLHVEGDEAWWRWADEPFGDGGSGPSSPESRQAA